MKQFAGRQRNKHQNYFDMNLRFLFFQQGKRYTPLMTKEKCFRTSKRFWHKVQQIYREYGYTIINVPYLSSENGAQFIIERLN